jgi:OmpA-OmpF porin, OOP family
MKTFSKFLLCATLILFAGNINAQIDFKGKLKNAVNNRANNHVDNAIDKGLDAVEKGVKDAATQKDSSSSGQNTEESSNENGDTTEKAKTQAKQEKVALQSYTKYDFVPGDKVLFYEDFSRDAVGDFPALWTTDGSGEVKTVNIAPGNWLNMNSQNSVYCYINEVKLPENFIFEFDMIASHVDDPANDSFSAMFSFFHANDDYRIDDLYPGDNGMQISMDDGNWNVRGYSADKDGKEGQSSLAPVINDGLNHVIVWVQKTRVRIYSRGQKVIDLPTILYPPTNFNRLRFSLWGCTGLPFVTNLRVTTAGADTRSKLLTEGKLISYGIYFDVNKDVVKPESYGALNDIAKILKENPDVRVKIIGYTDSDGADAANLDLSKRRGAAVKNELIKTFSIDASRIESDGNGEANPIAPNDTPANRALNRRVEFIKL